MRRRARFALGVAELVDKPIVCTWRELSYGLRSVHGWVKADVDRLHDIWKMGAPSPNSRVLTPKGYDPRVDGTQLGNYEARTVFPTPLSKWLMETSARRGIPMSEADARVLVRAIERAGAFHAR